jgi:hypothetical protein
MGDNERKPTWPQIRDALEVNEDHLLGAWLTGSFCHIGIRVSSPI